MVDRVAIGLPTTRIVDGSHLLASVDIRSGADAEVPTTLEWRLYNETRDELLVDWTTITAASSVTITISAQYNYCWDIHKFEKLSLVVAADRGMSSAVFGEAKYRVDSVAGYEFEERELLLYLLDQLYDFILDDTGRRILTDA